MKFGYLVMCHYKDDAPEPEGVVFFSAGPQIGQGLVLSCGHIYIITKMDWEDIVWATPVKKEGYSSYES